MKYIIPLSIMSTELTDLNIGFAMIKKAFNNFDTIKQKTIRNIKCLKDELDTYNDKLTKVKETLDYITHDIIDKKKILDDISINIDNHKVDIVQHEKTKEELKKVIDTYNDIINSHLSLTHIEHICLNVNGTKFQVGIDTLIKKSLYFRVMFTSDFLEKNKYTNGDEIFIDAPPRFFNWFIHYSLYDTLSNDFDISLLDEFVDFCKFYQINDLCDPILNIDVYYFITSNKKIIFIHKNTNKIHTHSLSKYDKVFIRTINLCSKLDTSIYYPIDIPIIQYYLPKEKCINICNKLNIPFELVDK